MRKKSSLEFTIVAKDFLFFPPQLVVAREDNRSLEFQGSLKLTLKFQVCSRSRGPVQKVSRVFKVEGDQKISRGKSS